MTANRLRWRPQVHSAHVSEVAIILKVMLHCYIIQTAPMCHALHLLFDCCLSACPTMVLGTSPVGLIGERNLLPQAQSSIKRPMVLNIEKKAAKQLANLQSRCPTWLSLARVCRSTYPQQQPESTAVLRCATISRQL